MTKRAQNGRYQVDKVGSPDPAASEYFVLDIVHDFEARVAVAKLSANYARIGQSSRAEECRQALDKTSEAHQAYCEAKNPKTKAKTSRKDRRA